MKDKIKAELQKKHAGLLKKLSPKALELLLDKLAPKVTTEDEIENFVDGLENQSLPFSDFVELIQKESDRRTREARTNLEKEFDFVPKKTKETPDDDEGGQPKDDDKVPAWAKKILQDNEELRKQVSGVTSKSELEKLKAAAKERGIPTKHAEKYQIGENYDQEAALEALEAEWKEIEAEYKGIQQVNVNAAVGNGRVMRGTASSNTKEASKEEVDEVVKNIM